MAGKFEQEKKAVSRKEVADAFSRVSGTAVEDYAKTLEDNPANRAMLDKMCTMFGAIGAELIKELFKEA